MCGRFTLRASPRLVEEGLGLVSTCELNEEDDSVDWPVSKKGPAERAFDGAFGVGDRLASQADIITSRLKQ
jgi:hypothetical protein